MKSHTHEKEGRNRPLPFAHDTVMAWAGAIVELNLATDRPSAMMLTDDYLLALEHYVRTNGLAAQLGAALEPLDRRQGWLASLFSCEDSCEGSGLLCWLLVTQPIWLLLSNRGPRSAVQ